ncbi:MAG: 30S ribosomal protein S14 [Alphaproteobacteria bacterium]|nr:30S ribosomal protein S14 [Alphaproteobacteria bacterium]
MGARTSVTARNKKRILLVARYAEKRKKLKEAGDWEGLQKLPRNSSPVRVRNRCSITGRPRGYLRKFGVSRIVAREQILLGHVPGFKKSSW